MGLKQERVRQLLPFFEDIQSSRPEWRSDALAALKWPVDANGLAYPGRDLTDLQRIYDYINWMLVRRLHVRYHHAHLVNKLTCDRDTLCIVLEIAAAATYFLLYSTLICESV
jgi:hypothetical protein